MRQKGHRKSSLTKGKHCALKASLAEAQTQHNRLLHYQLYAGLERGHHRLRSCFHGGVSRMLLPHSDTAVTAAVIFSPEEDWHEANCREHDGELERTNIARNIYKGYEKWIKWPENETDSSSQHKPAATWAKNPAKMAPKPLPQEDILKVLASQLSSNPRFRCSDTIHDSKAVNRRDVDIPPNMRPASKSFILGMCSSRLITISKRQNIMQPNFRP